MEQINCFAFYDLGNLLQDVRLRARRSPLQVWEPSASKAADFLHNMLGGGDSKFLFDESSEAAAKLLTILGDFILESELNPERVPDSSSTEIADLDQAIGNFNQALSLEMGRALIFQVSPKGVFDTRRLMNHADAAYEGYADRLPPEAIADTKAAGRCLAFSLFTAAGFHIARATEAVIKQYMAAYNCVPIKKSQRNWGKYTVALTAANANEIIIHHITQLKDLHRNPITHPEVTLGMAEAIALQAMCQSVIQSMVGDMESKRPVPNPDIVQMLPSVAAVGTVNVPIVGLSNDEGIK
jgi:hypothetical protein